MSLFQLSDGLTVVSPLNDSLPQASPQEQTLYEHFQECVQQDSPEELIERFRRLFVSGKDYQDTAVRSALSKLVSSKHAEQNFKNIVNRCCYILVNDWQQRQLEPAIPGLVVVLSESVADGKRYRTASRLQQLMGHFIQSDQYRKLQRLGRLFAQQQSCLGDLLIRYPYLYEGCLLGKDSSPEQQQALRQLYKRMQQRFELNLFQYVNYRVRPKKGKPATLQPVDNPTLLTSKELQRSLKLLVGTVEGSYTQKDLSQSFLTNSRQSSYGAFKDDLYDYLIASIDPRYGKHQFNEKLSQKLQTILPDCHAQKVDEFLLLRTVCQLLNFLTVESRQCADHYILIDLVTNLGTTNTVSLLLKVVLLCSKARPHLENRMALLFERYELSDPEEELWLIKMLENLQIALCTHFGKVDLSYLKQMA